MLTARSEEAPFGVRFMFLRDAGPLGHIWPSYEAAPPDESG